MIEKALVTFEMLPLTRHQCSIHC